MALAPGTHAVGPELGSLRVHTYRDGVAQKVGHDLVIAVQRWEATIEVQDGEPVRVALDADSASLEVREGFGGLKPLSDKDRADIVKSIDDKVLRRQPIAFRSGSVAHADGHLTVEGELTLVGETRPASFAVTLAADGRVTGTIAIVQTAWGIKPYKGLMGALKVRDTIEVVLDVGLPTR